MWMEPYTSSKLQEFPCNESAGNVQSRRLSVRNTTHTRKKPILLYWSFVLFLSNSESTQYIHGYLKLKLNITKNSRQHAAAASPHFLCILLISHKKAGHFLKSSVLRSVLCIMLEKTFFDG